MSRGKGWFRASRGTSSGAMSKLVSRGLPCSRVRSMLAAHFCGKGGGTWPAGRAVLTSWRPFASEMMKALTARPGCSRLPARARRAPMSSACRAGEAARMRAAICAPLKSRSTAAVTARAACAVSLTTWSRSRV
ncbi:hypothetical protein D3C72_1670730 [compost metagenome]